MRDNWLSNWISKSVDDIVDDCCEAWNNSSINLGKIMSIGTRDWPYGS